MISEHIIQEVIEELKLITKSDYLIYDMTGTSIASTCDSQTIDITIILNFIESDADSQIMSDCYYFKILHDKKLAYILISIGKDDSTYTYGKLAVSQISHLIEAYKEQYDKNSFYQNLLMDNLLLIDIYNKSSKLKVKADDKRVVYIIQTKGGDDDNSAIELLRNLFSESTGDFITSTNLQNIVLVKQFSVTPSDKELTDIAMTIVDMLNSEAMMSVSISYGTCVNDIKDVSKSYKEAMLATSVGHIFYEDHKVMSYQSLGIGRLIYQLPPNLCNIFMKEIFGDGMSEEIDEEILFTVSKFFENDLNVSETSRQLYIHRNTLVYRIERLAKCTGLDVRHFDDALTFRIAMMVRKHLKIMDNK